jgi:Tfp pilus assembly protein FimT
MRLQTRQPRSPGRAPGYSLTEMLIVIIIIMIMAAIALPGMMRFMRNYKVQGAAQQVASALQAARAKAIMKNSNQGVVFGVMDADTFGFMMPDAPAGEQFGPLGHLPTGVRFVPAPANAETTTRFDRMGRCIQETGSPILQCGDTPSSPLCSDTPGSYVQNIAAGPATGNVVVRMNDISTGVEWRVSVTPGGRIKVKSQGEPE